MYTIQLTEKPGQLLITVQYVLNVSIQFEAGRDHTVFTRESRRPDEAFTSKKHIFSDSQINDYNHRK